MIDSPSFRISRLKTKLGYSTLFRLISQALSFFSLLILTNSLAKEEYGIYSLSLMVVNLLLMILSLGGPSLLLYEFSKDNSRNQSILSSIVFTSLSLSVLILPLSFGLVKYFSMELFGQDLFPAFKILVWTIPALFISDIMASWFLAQQEVEMSQFLKTIAKSLPPFLAFLLTWVLFNVDIFNISMGYMLSLNSFVLICFLCWKKKIINPKIVNFKIVNWSHGFYCMLSSLVVALILSMDSFFIGYYLGGSEVAEFNVASRVLVLITLISSILEPIVASEIVKAKLEEAMGKFSRTLIYFSKLLLIVWAFFFLIFYLWGETFFKVFGDYGSANLILLVLMFGRLYDLIFSPLAHLLNIYGYSKILLFNTIIVLVVNLILNYVLVNRFGSIGIAIATSLAYFTQALLRTIQVKFLINQAYFKVFGVSLVATIIAIIAVLNRGGA